MTPTQSIRAGRPYRRLGFGILALGMVSLLVGLFVGRSFAGVAAYAAAVVAGFAVLFYVRFDGTMALLDEREAALERRASHATFQLFGYLGLFAFVALFLLDASGTREMAEMEVTLLYVYSVLSLSWGAVYVALRIRG